MSPATGRRLPLSPIQLSHLLLAEESNGRGYLNWVYQFNGRLDAEALATAIDELVQRFEILRTTFELRGGMVEQVVESFSPGILEIVDLTGGSKKAGITAAHRDAQARYLSLSPRESPNLQALLYRIGPKTSVLAIFVAESLVDSDSGEFLMTELSASYGEIVNRYQPAQARCPSFLDYLASDSIDAETVQRCRAHWSEQSREVPILRGWPTEAPHLGGGGRSAFTLDQDEWVAVLDQARASSTTPYIYVLSCLQMGLAETAGVRRCLVHSIATTRTTSDTEHLVGNFQSMVRISSAVEPRDRLEDVISRTGAEVAEALFHSYLPAPLTADGELESLPWGSPLPEIRYYMFSSRRGPVFPGTRRRRFRLHATDSRAPLTVKCIRGPGGRQDFDFLSTTAPQELVSQLAAATRHLVQTTDRAEPMPAAPATVRP